MIINIKANWASAKRGMNNVLKHSRSVGAGIKGAFSKVGSVLGSGMGMLGVGLGATAAVAGVKKLIDGLDDIGKTSANLGVSTDYFQKMQFAADRTGTELGSVTTAFTKLKKLAGQAVAGDLTGIESFAAIGMSIKDIKKLNPEQLFDEVTNRLNSMTDASLKDGASADLLGKNFAKLNNFMGSHIALGKELQGMGSIIDADQIKAAEDYKDAVSNMSVSLKSLAVNSGFMSQISEISKAFENMIIGSKKMKALGITSEAEKQDKKEGITKKITRIGLNLVGDLFAPELRGKDHRGIGDKLFKRPSELAMSTAPIDRQKIKDDMAKKAAMKKEVDAAAQLEAEKTRLETKTTRDTKARNLAKSKASAKDVAEVKLKETQKAMAKATGTTASGEAKAVSSSTTGKEAVDNLRRIGGYSGGRTADQVNAAMAIKKQTDLLSSVDKKMAVLEHSARTGGLVFP